jgi:hypothetical protein
VDIDRSWSFGSELGVCKSLTLFKKNCYLNFDPDWGMFNHLSKILK